MFFFFRQEGRKRGLCLNVFFFAWFVFFFLLCVRRYYIFRFREVLGRVGQGLGIICICVFSGWGMSGVGFCFWSLFIVYDESKTGGGRLFRGGCGFLGFRGYRYSVGVSTTFSFFDCVLYIVVQLERRVVVGVTFFFIILLRCDRYQKSCACLTCVF